MTDVVQVIENKGLDLGRTDAYAAILGESPSKGAKSPSLWNRAFRGMDMSCEMHPMDVKKERLRELVQGLRSDSRFIGGAVAVPYKTEIIPLLDGVEREAEKIGAVNCLYRKAGKLIGANTDGAGGLLCLEQFLGEPVTGKTVLLLGTGGAGFAMAAYLASAMGPHGTLILSNRSPGPRDRLAERLREKWRVRSLEWPISPQGIEDVEVLVNCSSIGFGALKQDAQGVYSLKCYTPLGPMDDSLRVDPGSQAEREYLRAAADRIKDNIGQSLKVLAALKDPVIFDIVYQPAQTMLLYLSGLMGYRILNGLCMNLEQAVVAFEMATVAAGMKAPGSQKVRQLMKEVY